MVNVLRSLTIPLPSTHPAATLPLTEFLRPGTLIWSRRDEGLLGFGVSTRATFQGPDRFADAQDWWRSLHRSGAVINDLLLPGTGPVAFGSFAFSRYSQHESVLVMPRLLLGRRDGLSWLTLTTVDADAGLTAEEALASLDEVMAQQAFATAVPATASEKPDVVWDVVPGSLTETDWKAAVAQAVTAIEGGEVDKVVLARDLLARSSEPVNRESVLAALARDYRDCWVYGVGQFVGATPEMLIKVEDGVARARVLAGTVDRAQAPQDPGYPRRELLDSAKQREEHEFAVRSLVKQLAPFAEDLHYPAEPFILELPNVWHLASDVQARLAASHLADGGSHLPTSLALVEALHPTAAVCGTPRTEAGELIQRIEHLERGPYAGPVGWLDAQGNGEWGIGLRGGVIEGSHQARLYAGCGIVAASQPEAELAETWAKFRPMLQALGATS
ncbi:isochorismate synthase [Psychromicrobium xiongbiense]|uniref:isochorismate synthase n=1 Tax=Psychromicrobium xiongbiense TaxID=3051184 RepID=UPI002557B2E1|nr:isochorismate synthase [Psychromicrobium sp. YIM S02556]